MRFDLASRKIHAALVDVRSVISEKDDELILYLSDKFAQIRETADDMSIEGELCQSEYTELKSAVVAGRMDEALSIARDRGLFEVVLTYLDAVAESRT